MIGGSKFGEQVLNIARDLSLRNHCIPVVDSEYIVNVNLCDSYPVVTVFATAFIRSN